jgi:hypothetical protein
MFLADSVVADPVPADLLAPFATEDQRMIQQEAAADPAFARLVSDALARPGGPQLVAQSARKAIANELNPKMYPESVGTWPVLRRMTDELASTTASNVIAKVNNMSFSELVNAVEGIAANKKPPGVNGMGQIVAASSSLSVIGGLATGLAAAGAAIYTSHVVATTTKAIANIQASVIINSQNVQSEIARAQAAMATATASIQATQLQQQQVALQQSQVNLQQQQLAAQQAQQAPPTPDQTSVDASISTTSSAPSPGPQPTVLTPAPPPPPPPPPMASSPVTTLGPATQAPIPAAVVLTGPPAPPAPNLLLPIALVGGAGAAALLAHHFLGEGPAGSYIGKFETDQFDRLSKPVQHAIAMEAEGDPAFITGYLIPTLRGPDPEKKILADIAHEVHMADMYGMGYLGRSFWKKVVRAVKKVVVTLPVKIIKWTTPKFLQKIVKKIGRPVMKVWHKYGPIIISVVGGVMSIFLGPVAAAAAALLSASVAMYNAKKAAANALSSAKHDANAQLASANAQQAQVSAQVDAFYSQNQPWFLSHDITPASWAQLNLDQKIAIINAGATGTLPAGTVQVGSVSVPPTADGISYGEPGWTPPPGYAIPAAPPPSVAPTVPTPPPPQAAGVTPAYVAPPPAAAPPPPPPTQAMTSTAGAPTSDYPTDVPMAPSAPSGGGGGSSYGGAESTDTGSAPGQAAAPISTAADQTSTGTSTSAVPPAPAGQYQVVVEGQTIATVAALSDATTAAMAATKPGDRFEILLNGQTTGLNLRTSTGSIAVSGAQDAAVRAMTHAQTVALIANAEQQAAGQGAAAPAGAPSLLVPGIIAGALAIGAAVLSGGRKH